MAKKETEPSFWTDAQITAAQDEGRKIRENPRSIMPALAGWGQEPSGRDTLISALMGFGKSMQNVQQASALGDPFTAALAGIAGAGQQPGPQAVAQQRQMAALEATPIDQVSPGMVEKYPYLSGVPLGLINRIAPLIQRSELFELAEAGRDRRAAIAAEGRDLNESERAVLAKLGRGEQPTEQDLRGVRRGAVPAGSIVPKELGAESGVKVVMAQDAKRNLADIRAMLSTPQARELILKAGGSFKKLTSLGDPQAEALANAIFQVADAEARIKTGAAINEKEVEAYFNGLVPKTGTIEGIKDRLDRKEKFFDSLNQTLTFGKRTAQMSDVATAETPDSIRELFRSGRISRDEAKRRIQALGGR